MVSRENVEKVINIFSNVIKKLEGDLAVINPVDDIHKEYIEVLNKDLTNTKERKEVYNLAVAALDVDLFIEQECCENCTLNCDDVPCVLNQIKMLINKRKEFNNDSQK